MAHLALYRKWRPDVFEDIVGQEHITKTLKNQILTNRVGHAYLFCGTRGTGKTTCAKVFSRAVNCLSPKDGSPCNECEICRGIADGSILDVTELDAASNRRIDDIREVISDVSYVAAEAKYSVYIIDEVHMLTTEAFNALLKTLEEPPEHVIFILATTDPQKVPQTILSRCQRFDFKRIEPEDIAGRIDEVAAGEGFTVEHEAAMLIARVADGGMRDALSLLDQCAGQSDNITAQLVSNVAGFTGRDHLFSLADCIKKSDCARALSIINELHNSSCDMERLCSQLIEHYRNLMIIRSVNDPSGLIVCTASELKQMEEQAMSYTLEHIMNILSVLESTSGNLRKGLNRRIETEMAFVRLCSPNLDSSVESLLKRIAALENAVRTGVSVKVGTTHPSQAAETTVEQSEPESAPQMLPDGELGCWPDIIEELKTINIPLASVLANSAAYIQGDHTVVYTNNPAVSGLLKVKDNSVDLRRAIFNITGIRYKIGLKSMEQTPEAPPPPEDEPAGKDPLEAFLAQAEGYGVKITN